MIVLPQPLHDIFSGRSLLNTGIGVEQDGQLTDGTFTTGSESLFLVSVARNLRGLTKAVRIHKTDALPDVPKTNNGG